MYSYNTLIARYFKERLAMPVYDPTIPVGLMQCTQLKRVQTQNPARERSPIRPPALQQDKGDIEIMYRHAQALPWVFCT